MNAVKNKPTPIQDAYNDLSNVKKTILKRDFMTEFGYTSIDTIYKKIKGETPLWPNEQKWLVKIFAPIELKFPTK